MPKRQQEHKAGQTKSHQTNRVGTSVSVDPEIPNQFQEQLGSAEFSSQTGFAPSYDDIQKKAYQIHEEKGGSDLENWLEAERALKEEHR